jgi:hypothetical protein
MSDDEDINRNSSKKKSGFQFDVNVDDITQKINLGIEKLSKNIKSGFERASIKLRDFGQNQKGYSPVVGGETKTDMQQIKESDSSEISCGCCGCILGDELLSALKSGNEVICENCGIVMKMNRK